ncbi:hypothetical protein J4462_04730 [Candidatus Pacearchaeota archaeon]|nr:hypothetical protein [Candidatus Pacearchaeota archaeon]
MRDKNIRHGTMKPRSVMCIDDAILHFNSRLKSNRNLDTMHIGGITLHNPDFGNNQILLQETTRLVYRSLRIDFEINSFYQLDEGGIPVYRVSPVVLDIRDYYAKSLLKRPANVNLALYSYQNEKEIFRSVCEINSERGSSRTVIEVALPNPPTTLSKRYEPTLKELSVGDDFKGVIDLAFRIYDETM